MAGRQRVLHLLNLIANTFWRMAPLGPTFSLPAVFIALVVHLLVSVLFGVLIATIAAITIPDQERSAAAVGPLQSPSPITRQTA